MEYLSERRKKLIDKNLNEQLKKHTELLVINSETCKYLAKRIGLYVDLSEYSDGMSEPAQDIKKETAMRAKRYSEIYNDYCKF